LKSAPSTRGFTLVEALVAVSLVGIVAVVAIPTLMSRDPVRLQAAATEVGNMMRFAMSEASRRDGYVLIDAATPGRLRLVNSDAAGAVLGTVEDPLTKRPMEIDSAAPPWSGELAMTAKFVQSSVEYQQLLVSPTGQLEVLNNGTKLGPLHAGSGVEVRVGVASGTVAIAETTGRVTIP
jgi:prepilin-type N-terminal cleavage/methylation domain-containing protein